MTWNLLDTFIQSLPTGNSSQVKLSDYSIQFNNVSQLEFVILSDSAEDDWYRAGYLSIFELDETSPADEAQVINQILPLRDSRVQIPSAGLYRLEINWVPWLNDVSLAIHKRSFVSSGVIEPRLVAVLNGTPGSIGVIQSQNPNGLFLDFFRFRAGEYRLEIGGASQNSFVMMSSQRPQTRVNHLNGIRFSVETAGRDGTLDDASTLYLIYY